MADVIRMPRMSDTMEEGTIVEWHKKVGDQVESGDLLAEIETDKATMELESYFDGTLLHIGVEKGDAVPIDAVLAVIGEEGEDYKEVLEKEQESGESKDSGSEDKEDVADSKKEESTSSTKERSSSGPSTSTSDSASSTGRIKASPLAKKIAEEKGIDLSSIEGSGDNGRIVKRDVEQVKESSASTQAIPSGEAYEDIPVSQMRKTIARRLGESKFSAPHFYLTMEINMDAAIEARSAINEMIEGKVSFNDIILKSAAIALKQHPMVNASWLGDKIRLHKTVNMGVAVAVSEGLLVPVVKNIETKGLQQISEEVKSLASKANDKKLQPEEMQGNTFTVSNLGMFGIEEFTAIINPPDVCILAVGGIAKRPVKGDDDEWYESSFMKVTLSCDHRVVDGATGSKFLQTFKALLENPMRMIL